MDVHNLFLSCKKGDINTVQYLVEQKEVDLNVRDKWDSTPLYYACLCGHEELVKYLLENGAKCQANTFDGERCLYGALNNEIRNLLKSFKVITTQIIRRDLYKEFLRRLLERGSYEDVAFVVLGKTFSAHRCILSARCSYFAEMFETKWKDKREIHFSHKKLYPWAFEAVLQYIYTGVLETNTSSVEDVLMVARQCKFNDLVKKIEDRLSRDAMFEMSKPCVNVTVLIIEPTEFDCDSLQTDMGTLADQALPPEFTDGRINEELPFPLEDQPTYSDVCFVVDAHHFMCHQAFFCGRSDYFRALVIDHFGESLMDDNITMVNLHDISADTFIQVMYYVYQDYCELTTSNVYDVLCAADVYLLPGLKRQCANIISQYLEIDDVVSILRTARMFSLPKLENTCMEFMADNLEQIVTLEEFKELVMEDAQSVKKREETDSIEIIDDVRFHITNFVQTFSDVEQANAKLVLIDHLLEDLNLDA